MHDTTRTRQTKPRLVVVVQYAIRESGLPSGAQVRRWVSAAASGDGAVTVRFVDQSEGQILNAGYRGKDHATNVLSFAYSPPPQFAGDVVLCVPVVRLEAERQGKGLAVHFAHLIVHGILHLQGYEHESEYDASLMEAKERDILRRLGYADPYSGEP